MTDYVQTKAQLLARLQGGQQPTLLMRDLIETLFNETDGLQTELDASQATLQSIPRSTTTALADIADAINTTGKFAGKVVINTTAGTIVTADDSAAADVWLALDGTTAHTPV